MLIPLLLRLIATIFVARPPGVTAGQWSPHANQAVRTLESRHFRMGLPAHAARRPAPPLRAWKEVQASMAPGAEGEWKC